jgi:hypothetical protein
MASDEPARPSRPSAEIQPGRSAEGIKCGGIESLSGRIKKPLGPIYRHDSQPGNLAQNVRVEEAFKNLKGDLAIRPIFHQDQARIEGNPAVMAALPN